MRAALDFSINDRNLFEMKIFLTISIQIKKGTLPVSTFMVERVFGGVQWVKKQIFCLHRNRKRRGTRGEYYTDYEFIFANMKRIPNMNITFIKFWHRVK
jgi:hypothetical protein